MVHEQYAARIHEVSDGGFGQSLAETKSNPAPGRSIQSLRDNLKIDGVEDLRVSWLDGYGAR